MLLSYLKDLTKYTHGLGVECLKLEGKSGQVSISGIDDNKSLVIKGKFIEPVIDLDGISGLGNIDILLNLVNGYSEKNDSVSVVRNDRIFMVEQKDDEGKILTDSSGNPIYNEITENVIEQIIFERPSPKMRNSYRLMDRRMIPPQYKSKSDNWNVSIKPTSAAINLLTLQNSFGAEEYFGVKTDGGILYLVFGENDDQGYVEFAKDVEGEITKPWVWHIGQVLSILKLSESAECTMSFENNGGLHQITLNTGMSEYNYIMPPRTRS